MNKEKPIEEMRRFIRQGFIKADCKNEYTGKPYPYFESQISHIAEALYNAGYRKVPYEVEKVGHIECEDCELNNGKCEYISDWDCTIKRYAKIDDIIAKKQSAKEFADKLKKFIVANTCVVYDDVNAIYHKIDELLEDYEK